MNISRKLTQPSTVLAAVLLCALFASAASAKTTCRPTPQGAICRSEVDFDRFAGAYSPQMQSQWCWAASISMLFSYYKHPVSQETIVASLYGRLVDLPSGPGWNIASRLNRPWADASGKNFQSTLTAAFDPMAGVNNINNAWLVNELDQERPFIIGTAGHAVVGTAIDYFPTPVGPNVVGVGVFDPWPGRGARSLSPAEMTPVPVGGLQFLATVRVSE
jgi:hypothetical protein